MKYFIILSIVMALASCTEQSRNLSKMEKQVKKSMEEKAFKDGGGIDWLEYKNIDYIVSDENSYDTMQANYYANKALFYLQKYNQTGLDDYSELAKENTRKSKMALIFWKPNPKKIYIYRAFVKASIYKGNTSNKNVSQNILDTIYRTFDENLNLIDISE